MCDVGGDAIIRFDNWNEFADLGMDLLLSKELDMDPDDLSMDIDMDVEEEGEA